MGVRLFFYNRDESEIAVVEPVMGMALFYPHSILVEDRKVTRGKKFCLKVDVLYSSPQPQGQGSCVLL